MSKLNNEFIRASKDFEVSIGVVVSRPASVTRSHSQQVRHLES